MKKKKLFIVEAMGGGVFTYIVDLANELAKSNDMYIAYGIRPQTPSNYKDYFNKDIHLIKVENFTREINPSKDIKAFFEIQRIAKEVNPDIIHLHSSKAGALGRFAFNGKDIPLFYTPHGYSFLMEDRSSSKRRIYKTIETICAKRNCMTISCSLGEYKETLKLTSNATYVNNGINIEDLEKILKNTKTFKHPFTVSTLGRASYQKNPSLFNLIASKLPNIKFIWIGDGELKEELNSKNVEVTCWVNRDKAIEKLVNTDVFLLTSRWEGLPISLLEAMYMKKPCVVSNVIGNRDVINNNHNGYVCEEVDHYINSINNIQTNNQDDLINEAYKDILNEYNTKEMSRKYIEVYMGGADLLSNLIEVFNSYITNTNDLVWEAA